LVGSRGTFKPSYDLAISNLENAEFRVLRTPLDQLLKRNVTRMRLMNIYSLLACRSRRSMMAQQTLDRLLAAKEFYRQDGKPDEETLKEREILALRSIHDNAALMDPLHRLLRQNQRTEAKKERKICCEKLEPHPAMIIKSTALSGVFVRYHAGRFISPKDKARLNREYGNAQAIRKRDQVRFLMQQPSLTPEQKRTLLLRSHEVMDLWGIGLDCSLDKPWRTLQFSTIELIRGEMTLAESTATPR